MPYFTTTGLYFGTSNFITLQPIRYATAHTQKIIIYPAGLPSKPMKVKAEPCASA